MYLRWMLTTRTAALLALLRVVGPLWPGSRATRERREARRIARTLARLGGLHARLGQHLAS